jgi:integrase
MRSLRRASSARIPDCGPLLFILSPADIRRLVGAASRLGPEGSLCPHTYTTLFALLACTGLRVSEAHRLLFEDITPDGLIIRETKFRKSRLVPLHETAQAGLERYLVRRRRVAGDDDHVFVSLRGRALQTCSVDAAFQTAVQALAQLPHLVE